MKKFCSCAVWLVIVIAFVPAIGKAQSADLFKPGMDLAVQWHTFLGSGNNDWAEGVTVDGSGNVYVIGTSVAAWGTPINAHAGSADAFVAKFNSSGTLLWHTFLGSGFVERGTKIAIDGGDVYVTGLSPDTWGTPIIPYAGDSDAFVAKLNSSGILQWNTFLGSVNTDYGWDIAVEGGDVYVAGYSLETWGTPLNAYSGGEEAFVAKLNSSGALQWHTFLGSASTDDGTGIAADGSGVYVTGFSLDTWGTPISPHHPANYDAFVAKLNSSGTLLWNTFLGSATVDDAYGIAVDGGNVYVTGGSDANWGTPIRPFTGIKDVFVANLKSSGALQWNTFLGSANFDLGYSIATDGSGIYVTGWSTATWGTPLDPYIGSEDVFVAGLDNSGTLQWNTFMGSVNIDYGRDVAVDGSDVYVTGKSDATWGTPINPYAGAEEAFVVQLSTSCPPCPGGVRGDVNADGMINVLDVMLVVNHILGITVITDPGALCRADCKCDGIINILDALKIVNVILGIGTCGP